MCVCVCVFGVCVCVCVCIYIYIKAVLHHILGNTYIYIYIYIPLRTSRMRYKVIFYADFNWSKFEVILLFTDVKLKNTVCPTIYP